MAETGKKAAEGSAQPTTDPAPDIARNEGDQLATPNESRGASIVVKCSWPHSKFTVEGVPVVTSEGTRLTKPQLEEVQKAALASGVSLHVEGDN